MSKISIIIPILNEAETIEKLLIYLFETASKETNLEIIVVDGGSTDGSKSLVSKFKNVMLLTSEKGRAKQMNLGAKQATGNILYFLHADSFPPKNFDKLITAEIKKGNNAGCFIMKFDSNHLWLKLAGFLTKLPWKICRGGDQSLFVSKSLFNTIGGFDETFVIYEDNDFIGKLYAQNQFVVIQKWLTTSARRYKTNGIWTLQYHFFVIHLKKWCGASAENLNSYYKKHVNVKN
ncbi:TIGR04283 family arsenosugar biosynthesis glycosyltransferase [Mariniflexile jejuense]|uniref:TIGR04283 family arsenosugar biosynthesis glycosyltransferase n=1 Tax=Mariniflexile jejuense TaxID=1173582 RepID=A0ABW3JHR7_9FLAO